VQGAIQAPFEGAQIRGLTLPDYRYSPTLRAKSLVTRFVAVYVALKLWLPVFQIALGLPRQRASVLMPEAAIHEYR
jgi:hypothetical protein